jgi:hypothetical protein
MKHSRRIKISIQIKKRKFSRSWMTARMEKKLRLLSALTEPKKKKQNCLFNYALKLDQTLIT